jgi:YidC/Oxa1 family membrane protein insertase
MLIPMLINKSSDKNTRIMMAVMAVMMIFFGWSAPAGVLLYWDASSLLGVAQQTIQQRLMKSKDDTEEALMVDVTPVKVDVDRKERKARPRRKK